MGMVAGVIGVCGVGLALLVRRYDIYDREPSWLLLLTVLLGMLTGWAAGRIEDPLILAIPGAMDSHLHQAMIASGVEESAKLAIVLLIAFVFPTRFNDPIDGLIYGAFAGLGAGLEESLFYLQLAEPQAALIGTECVRLLLHLLMGGLAGFGVGYGRFRIRRWKVILPVWFAMALTVHFLWDWICGLPAVDLETQSQQRWTAIGLMLFTTVAFGVSVQYGSRRSAAVHRGRGRLWGWPFRRSSE